MTLQAALRELLRRLEERSLRCIACGEPLQEEVCIYRHDGGYLDEETGARWWIHVPCSRCGYQNAAWKLLNRLEEAR